MKTILVATLLILVSASAGFSQQAPKALTRAEFDRLLDRPEKLLIVDVRRPDEISAVGGFPVYLNVQIDDLEKELAWIPKDRVIVTVSNHGSRNNKAAELLISKGFTVAGTLGAQTYEEEGGHLLKIVAPRPSVSSNGGSKQ